MRWLTIAPLILAVAAQAGEIYRTVDEQGNVVYTDSPTPEQREDAEPVEVRPPNTFDTEAARVSSGSPARGEEAGPGTDYRLVIREPEHDATVRANDGNVDVVTGVDPALRGNHRLQLLLDGNVLDVQPEGDTWHLLNLDRGTHQLVLQVVDPNERGPVAQSAPSVFHLQRASVLQRTRGAP